MKQHFLIINFDGWNLGLKAEDFDTTWLEFDSFQEAAAIANHWDEWINQDDASSGEQAAGDGK